MPNVELFYLPFWANRLKGIFPSEIVNAALLLAWALITVAPNMETSVSKVLTCLDFDHIVFRVRRRIVYRGRVIERILPVFPGYIFVLARNAWRAIQEIIGVLGFVRTLDGRPETVPNRVVNGLRAQSDEKGVLSWPPPAYISSRFRVGDIVRVYPAGIPEGLRGVFHQLLTPERAVILLDWMGRMVPLSVDERDLIAVPQRRKRRRRRRNSQGGTLVPLRKAVPRG